MTKKLVELKEKSMFRWNRYWPFHTKQNSSSSSILFSLKPTFCSTIYVELRQIQKQASSTMKTCAVHHYYCLHILSCFLLILSQCISAAPQVPAMFVFGDSLVDNGNNNYLASYARSNYMPYGVDFNQGPTGRFCNGKTTVDFIGEQLGLPDIPPYVTTTTSTDGIGMILHGVNYASAAGGVLPQTGQHLGGRFSFSQQVANFGNSLDQLRDHMGVTNLTQYLAKSIVIINIASNDYANNYLMPALYPTSYFHTPEEYAKILIDSYTSQIQGLYNTGLRKFVLGGIGPLGCIPNQLATGLAPPGRCVNYVNEMVGLFNVRLRSLVDNLNGNHTDGIFVYGNTYGAIGDILNDPSMYGFTVRDAGCCGIGRNRGQITCLPYSLPCTNRAEYVFWDAFHPTEAVNAILAKRGYEGPPSDVYPINIRQMLQI